MIRIKNIVILLVCCLVYYNCNDDIEVDYANVDPVTTAYSPRNRVFYDEILAQGQFLPGTNYKEFGFYISKNKLNDANRGYKHIATEVTESTFREWIGGLEAGTNYYIKAYGITEDGDELMGGEIRVTTPTEIIDYVTLEEPDILNEGRNAREQSVYGIVTDFGNDTDGVIEYGAYYWPLESPEQKKKIAIETTSLNKVELKKPFEVKISGLIPSSKYVYQTYARNNRKEQLFPEAEFTTQDATTPSVQTNEMNKVSTTMGVMSGIILDNGNDPDAEYGFYFGTDAANLTEKLVATNVGYDNSLPDQFSFEKRMLSKLTTYYIQAYISNFSAESRGEVIRFTTLDASIPILLSQFYNYQNVENDITDTSVTVYANLFSDGGEEITECGTYWGYSMDELTNKTVGSLKEDGETVSVTINGLENNEIIYYRIYAVNSLGVGQVSTIESVGTKISVAAYYNTGDASDKLGIPNDRIKLHDFNKNIYYELPPITVIEGGKTYRYYFLDRNLGATKVADDATKTMDINAIGDQYRYSYPRPAAVVASGTGSQAANGWNKGTNVAQCQDWNQDIFTPSPINYYIPTVAEWKAFINALPEQERNMEGAYKAIKLGATAYRNQNGGPLSATVNAKYAMLYAADCTNSGPSMFEARPKNSSTDGLEDMCVGSVAPTEIYQAMQFWWVSTVRCFRKMEVVY